MSMNWNSDLDGGEIESVPVRPSVCVQANCARSSSALKPPSLNQIGA